jgi:hypothetical protein
MNLQLRAAQARLTPSTADDRAVTEAEKQLIEARLAEARTLEEQIALTNALADIRGQLNEQEQEQYQGLLAYLAAQRELARSFGSNVIGSAIGGSPIYIVNHNNLNGSDPHLWSNNVAFELKALIS